MTQLERQIRVAQHRLGLNNWLVYLCRSLTVAATIFAALILVQRLYAAPIPLLWFGVGLGGGALAMSIIWTTVRRVGPAFAAATLDQAAGLKERLSSGRYCLSSAAAGSDAQDDPFARAVVADAELASTSLSARQHIRLAVPKPLTITSGSILLAALLFLVPSGLLERSEATELSRQAIEARETKVAVKRKMDEVRQIVEANPVLAEMKEELEWADKDMGSKLTRPTDMRHLAAKQIDRLQDAVKRKQQSDKYGAVNEMRKMMRGLKVPKQSTAQTQKLVKALAQADFKTAREEVKELREQLATLKAEGDKELVAKMTRQLDDLAKQLEQLSRNKNLAKKLQQAGLKKEDVDRLLENLKKKDLDQLKKKLEEKGWNQQQIQKMVKQLQKQQQAGAMAKKLAQSMGQAAQGSNPGQMGEAMDGLSMAADQLSELEQLEQEMSQMDAALAGLQNAKDDIENSCPKCNGTGMQNGKMCGQ